MPDSYAENQKAENSKTDSLKSWIMVALTLIFVFLYAAALVGWLKPLTDTAMVSRLEPIIFVIIGYYFGRLPAQRNEKTLKEEINRQTQKADAAQQIKEKAQQEREVLEEKIKNAKIALNSTSSVFSCNVTDSNKEFTVRERDGSISNSLETAMNILNS